MSLKAWLKQGSPKILGGAVATSLCAGLGAGVWLQLPGYLSEPVTSSPPRLVQTEDPGRAQWREVINSLGGLAATRIAPSFRSQPRVALTEHDPGEREADRLFAQADLEREIRAAERRTAAWGRDRDWNRRQADRARQAEAPRYAPPREYGYVAVAPAPPVYAGPPVYEGPRPYDGYAAVRPGYAPALYVAPRYEEPRYAEPRYAPPPREYGPPPRRYRAAPRYVPAEGPPPVYNHGMIIEGEPIPPPPPRPSYGW